MCYLPDGMCSIKMQYAYYSLIHKGTMAVCCFLLLIEYVPYTEACLPSGNNAVHLIWKLILTNF